MPDAALDGQFQFFAGFVVAVQGEAVGGKAGLQRDIKFAKRGDVHAQALLRDQAGHRQREKGFAGVVDLDWRIAAVEGGLVIAAVGADRGFVHHIERRSELRGKSDVSQPPISRWPCALIRCVPSSIMAYSSFKKVQSG